MSNTESVTVTKDDVGAIDAIGIIKVEKKTRGKTYDDQEFVNAWLSCEYDPDLVAEKLGLTRTSVLARVSKIRNNKDQEKQLDLPFAISKNGSRKNNVDYQTIREDVAKIRGISLEELQKESEIHMEKIRAQKRERLSKKENKEKTFN